METCAIGRLRLHPYRELLDHGSPVVIGGRALDLLSALAAADGEVISKDELLAKVWRGVIVEDNALQAQISAVRKALGSEAQRLVTVHGRGYRLMLNGGTAEPAISMEIASRPAPLWPQPTVTALPRGGPTTSELAEKPATRPKPTSTRRAAVGALAAAACGAAIGLSILLQSRRHIPDPRAIELYRRGQLLERTSPGEEMGRATDLYEQAVAIDPEFAAGWAALALSYRSPHLAPLVAWSDPRPVELAARRALALDPDNADARLALIRRYPYYRRWRWYETRLLAFLAHHPRSAYGNRMLAVLLLDVGRCEEAVACARRAKELEPANRQSWFILGLALGQAGRHSEALLALDHGLQNWPRNLSFWTRRFGTLIDAGRYVEAAAFLRDRSRRLPQIPEEMAQGLLTVVDALIDPAKRAKTIESFRRHPVRSHIENFVFSAPLWVGLGMSEDFFATVECYFFGGTIAGNRIDPPGRLDPRPSLLLFSPSMLRLQGDPRWSGLLQRIGLEDYWRKSGTRPDFRRS